MNEQERLRQWRQRVKDAIDLHDSWESTFRCAELQGKYVGVMQWTEEEDPDNDKYYVNLFFSGIETRRPALVFAAPRFRVRPHPSRLDDPTPPSEYRAKLYEDTLNTLSIDRRVGMLRQALLAIHESFFRFGVIEVGIRGDVVDNPNAERPVLDDKGSELLDSDGKTVDQGQFVLNDERPYIKKIPASKFIVSNSNKEVLEHNDWVGYWDFVRLEDIKANPFYSRKVANQVKATGYTKLGESIDESEVSAMIPKGKVPQHHNKVVRLYKVWDLRGRRRYVFCDTGDGFLHKMPFKTLPLVAIKFHDILESFYPIPPTYNWIPQQRELNDTRQMQRVHRRRFLRKYLILDGYFDVAKLDDLESDTDGVYVPVDTLDRELIKPLQDAPLDRSIHLNVPSTKEDFMLVSGITGEQRGVQEAETATQANIIDVNSRIRESFSRQLVADWMSQVARVMLLILRDQASMEFWVRTNVDPESPSAPQEMEEIGMAWKLMKPEHLADVSEFEVTIDLESMSPNVEQMERQSWLSVLQLLSNPQLGLLLSASDVILRKTLNLHGIRSEKEILEIKRAVAMVLNYQVMSQILMAQGVLMPMPFDMSNSGRPSPTGAPLPGGGPMPGAQPGEGAAAPGPTPGNQAIAGQLQKQLPAPR